jgi:two-component system, NtrC family, sensor histidine kinase HydH
MSYLNVFKDIPSILATFWFGFWGAVATLIMIFFLREGLSLTYYQLIAGGFFVLVVLTLAYFGESRRREHRARIRSERLAAVGMAVSEISHDMKTPLMAIGGFAAQGQRGMGEDDPGRAKMDLVIKEVARLEAMVKDILNFSRPLRLRSSSSSLT